MLPDSLEFIKKINYEYKFLINIFGIPRNESKDYESTVVKMLKIKIDFNLFEARFSAEKLRRTFFSAVVALKVGILSLYEADTLAGFLFFYSRVVRLGRVFISSIWEFILVFFLI